MRRVAAALAALACACASPAEEPAVEGLPPHVWLEGEEVVLPCPDAKGEGFRLEDFFRKDARALQTQKGAAELRLGKLPKGWYRLCWSEGAAEREKRFAVVAAPADRPSGPSRFAIDVAAGDSAVQAYRWEERSIRFLPSDVWKKALARLTRLAGVPWIRERGAEPVLTAIERAEGLRISTVWSGDLDDLHAVWQRAKIMAERCRDHVQVWEVGNERDGYALGSDDAACLKAAYLGFHAGDPSCLVAMGSLAWAPTPYADSLFANGVGGYFDRYNYHSYLRPQDYPEMALLHYEYMKRAGAEDRPVWMTEAGVCLSAQGGVEGAAQGRLSWADEEKQARYVAELAAYSLWSGTDKHFLFILPHFHDKSLMFGFLMPDLSPRPAYAALATLTWALGRGECLGRLKDGVFWDGAGLDGTFEWESRKPQPGGKEKDKPPEIGWDGFLFDRGPYQGHALVLWAEREREVTLKLDVPSVRVVDLVGRESRKKLKGGKLTLTVDAFPRYVLLPERHAKLNLEPPVRKPRPLEESEPGSTVPERVEKAGGPLRHVVLRMRLPHGLVVRNGRTQSFYRLDKGKRYPLDVQVYNFGAEALVGEISFSVPKGLRLAPDRIEGLRVEPGERFVASVELDTVDLAGVDDLWLKGVVRSERGESSPAALCLSADPKSFPEIDRRDLAWKAADWSDYALPGGKISHEEADGGALAYRIDVAGAKTRIVSSAIRFSEPLDLSGFDALAFTFRVRSQEYDDPKKWHPAPETSVRPVLVDAAGTRRVYPEWGALAPGETRVLFPFGRFTLEGIGIQPLDPPGRLPVRSLDLVIKTNCDHVELDLSRVEWIRWRAPEQARPVRKPAGR